VTVAKFVQAALYLSTVEFCVVYHLKDCEFFFFLQERPQVLCQLLIRETCLVRIVVNGTTQMVELASVLG
jgi:hypothetical protein